MSEDELTMEEVLSVSHSHLEPFPHQVAGQSLVFRYDAHTICKSLIDRELKVYQTLPDTLKPYVPQYRGVVDVALNGPKPEREKEEEEEEEEEKEERGEGGQEGVKHPLTTQRLLDKVAKRQGHDNVYHFLLLENIVACYQRPCVLDLKLGTRQHGDDAPLHKVLYQLNKCRNTTSALLGVRLCGMKVYRSATGDYAKVDKTEGRRMREDDFREAMRQFLFNGRHIRRELIPILLLKLQRLKAAISKMSSFRFYSSSLLVVYDGVEFKCECKRDISSDMCPSVSTNGVPEYGSGTSSCLRNGDEHSIYESVDGTGIRQGRTRSTDAGKYNRIPSFVENSNTTENVNGGPVTSPDRPPDIDLVSIGEDNRQENDNHVLNTNATCGGDRKENAFPNGEPVTSVLHISTAEGTNEIPPREYDSENVRSSDNKDMGRNSDSVFRSDRGLLRKCLQNFEGSDFRTSDRDAVVSSSALEKRTETEKKRTEEEMNREDVTNGHRSAVTASDGEKVSRVADQMVCECYSQLVDVRMVDFAHTTHAGFREDSIMYQGPDQGYLLGLHTLIDTFTLIYSSTADQEP